MQGARRRRKVAAAVLAALTALGLVVAAVQGVAAVRGSGHAAGTADDALAEIVDGEAELDRRRADLADADAALEAALDVAADLRRDLHGRVADRDGLLGQLTAAQARLGQLHAAISGTEVETQARAGLVTALGTCLDGVTELLNQLSVGDERGAARTASAIGPACATVGTVLG